MRSRLAAICGLLVPVVFTLGWIVGGFAQLASYDWMRHDISDLGAITADQPWIYNQIGANLTGILLFVFAVALWRELGSSRTARVGVGLLAIAGIGQSGSCASIAVLSIRAAHDNRPHGTLSRTWLSLW